MDKAERWLKDTLGYEFQDVDLFRQALTHRSAPGESNERLEFLGDAVLDTVISEVVFRAQPNSPEGDLSRLRSSLVKDTSLADLAADIGLGEYLILGSGERKSGGHRRESILADALEALIGGVYLDAGYEAAGRLVERLFGDRLFDLPDPRDLRDAKTRLQEWLQARQLALPEYELVDVSGQAHRQKFTVSCALDGVADATAGVGTSRRHAEQQAAERMLKRLKSAPK
ncbi:MAG: ribonuclease III [Woeseiaceae bacterium]|nr:ribonuclease III [Woeseiaceae bacterium]